MPTTSVSLRIDNDLLEYLKQRAEQEHRSFTNMIISILMEEKERKEGVAWLYYGEEQENCVSVPFSWLVKFCTHIDFKEPMSDEERADRWKEKLSQQFGVKWDD